MSTKQTCPYHCQNLAQLYGLRGWNRSGWFLHQWAGSYLSPPSVWGNGESPAATSHAGRQHFFCRVCQWHRFKKYPGPLTSVLLDPRSGQAGPIYHLLATWNPKFGILSYQTSLPSSSPENEANLSSWNWNFGQQLNIQASARVCYSCKFRARMRALATSQSPYA